VDHPQWTTLILLLSTLVRFLACLLALSLSRSKVDEFVPHIRLNLRTANLQKHEAVQGVLVLKAYRLVYHSTLGWRVITKKADVNLGIVGQGWGCSRRGCHPPFPDPSLASLASLIKKRPTPQDFHRALGIDLLKGPRRRRFLMNEVPLQRSGCRVLRVGKFQGLGRAGRRGVWGR